MGQATSLHPRWVLVNLMLGYNLTMDKPRGAQTLFMIYIRDGIALRFEPFKRMYENGWKIALKSTCTKRFK